MALRLPLALPRLLHQRCSSSHTSSAHPPRALSPLLPSAPLRSIFSTSWCLSGASSGGAGAPPAPDDGFDRSATVHAPSASDLSSFDVFGDASFLNLVHGYNEGAFQVSDVCLVGSIVVFKTGYLMWSPTRPEEISAASLAAVTLHHPVPSLVLVGTGAYARPLDPAVVEAYSAQGITLDVRATEDAVATFNFLLQEDRNVALCALPVGV